MAVAPSAPQNKIKYLTNKDLLEEIHKSKKSYSCYADERYSDYDIIVTDLKMVTDEMLEAARHKRAADRAARTKKERVAAGEKIKRGRKPVEGSKRQERMAARQAKIDAGIPLKPGRPKMEKPAEPVSAPAQA